LLATYLSATCPIAIAPAMDRDMFLHPSTQKNIETLQAYSCEIIPPQEGELASGLEGIGRMAEPEDIFDIIVKKKAVAQAEMV
jgi:phosphopantothenoylcysteine decarboxylase/phosphopantothenate--cysteine ligase